MSEIIKVGMADWKVCAGDDGLTTLGLGSCVGVAIRDPKSGIGGLAHVMLPDSTQTASNTNRAKFADTGITDMVAEMVKRGANISNMVAKLAGGAQMFAFGSTKSDMGRVGERNAAACMAKLKELKIKVIASDTGENYGRTVIFYPKTGVYTIKAVGRPEKEI
ncbi:MAG: chemotaxis protein CheD [Lachnospiraceae bacterium]|nr:chemotaxis protein CheD [Lachnospiraceae bacterium]